MSAQAAVVVRVSELEPTRELLERIDDAIGALENGDHLDTARLVADELRDALADYRRATA